MTFIIYSRKMDLWEKACKCSLIEYGPILPRDVEVEALLYTRKLCIVYKARTKKGEEVVVKISTSDEGKEQMINEYKILNGPLRGCPRVVQITLQYATNGMVVSVLKPVGKAIDYTKRDLIKELTPVLQNIHKRGVCHLDVKPDNIIDVNGELYLIDFGHALINNNKLDINYDYICLGYTACGYSLSHNEAVPVEEIAKINPRAAELIRKHEVKVGLICLVLFLYTVFGLGLMYVGYRLLGSDLF